MHDLRLGSWPAATWRSPSVRAAAYVALPWPGLAFPTASGVVLVAALSIAAAALLRRDPDADGAALIILAGLTACDLSPLSVAGSVVRLYQVSVLVFLVVVVRRRRTLLKGLVGLSRLPMVTIGVMLALTVITPLSLLWTISPTDSLVSSVGQASGTALLLVFAGAVATGLVQARPVLVGLWAMATASSAVAVTQFVVTVFSPLDLAAAGGSGVPWPRPSGLMTEAIWAALVAAMGAALAFALGRAHPRLAATSLALHVATLALVLSRAVALGLLFASLVWLVAVGRRYVTLARTAVALGAVAAALLAVGVAAPEQILRFDPRLVVGPGANADGGSAASRAAVYRLVADELPSRLPLGAGAGSLNKLTEDPLIREQYIEGGELNTGRGATNFFVGYAFDFGYMGAALALALVVLVFVLAGVTRRVDQGLALFLSTLLLVDFQFNNGFRFGFVHVLLGVLVGAVARLRSSALWPDARVSA